MEVEVKKPSPDEYLEMCRDGRKSIPEAKQELRKALGMIEVMGIGLLYIEEIKAIKFLLCCLEDMDHSPEVREKEERDGA